MNWSILLPSTWNLFLALKRLLSDNPQVASNALSDVFILITISIAVAFVVLALMLTLTSWSQTKRYLKLIQDNEQAASLVVTSNLPFYREFRHHLLDFPSRDGSDRMIKRRTVDAAEVFRESAFAPGFASSRLFLAIPGILTGLGVLGTFVGLQMGIGGLDLNNIKNIDRSIVPLIQGCAVAFSTSVWGVTASLFFSGCEKALYGLALRRVHKLQNRIDALFPRYVPEEAMSELERSSRGTEDLLKGLAVAIGAEMQTAIGRLGAEIKDAVSNATAEGQGPLMEKSAELLSNALTAELMKLKEQIGSMSDQFSEKFNGASDGLVKSVQGFQPTVEALSGAVGDAQRTVADAVAKLNTHEAVMQEMAEAALNIREAAESFGKMNETLTLSAERNQEACAFQLSAAQANERVAEQFSRIGERLPEIRQTLEDAARVIGSLGSPIADLQTLLAGQPELQRQLDNARATSESERSQILLKMSGDLAEKVGIAAQKFTEIGTLAEELSTSAMSLHGASSELAKFGQNVLQASKEQHGASEASRIAALCGERTAKALEPIPATIANLTNGLQSAGTSVRTGAEAARDSYRELIVLQEKWFAGATLGLNGMKDRLQVILKAYGDQVEGQTRNLMKQWTEEVSKCLASYETQVSELQGHLEELESSISKCRR